MILIPTLMKYRFARLVFKDSWSTQFYYMPQQEHVGNQPENILCVSRCVPSYSHVNPAIITFLWEWGGRGCKSAFCST